MHVPGVFLSDPGTFQKEPAGRAECGNRYKHVHGLRGFRVKNSVAILAQGQAARRQRALLRQIKHMWVVVVLGCLCTSGWEQTLQLGVEEDDEISPSPVLGWASVLQDDELDDDSTVVTRWGQVLADDGSLTGDEDLPDDPVAGG